jgi:hypothetical protein
MNRTLHFTCLPVMAVLLAAVSLQAQTTGYAYMRSSAAAPWNVISNEIDLDDCFGAGGWDDLRYETVSPAVLFVPGTVFIYMEGGDNNANALKDFLDNNSATIAAWVSAGGRLFINSAPNQGNGMSLGFGITLHFDPVNYSSLSNSAYSASTHAVFAKPLTPVGSDFVGGDAFSHAYLTGDGLSPILQDEQGRTVVAEKRVGHGLVVFGGMTMDVFQSPWPQSHNLRVNMIYYVATTTLTT